jgi:hypothetical protein
MFEICSNLQPSFPNIFVDLIKQILPKDCLLHLICILKKKNEKAPLKIRISHTQKPADISGLFGKISNK